MSTTSQARSAIHAVDCHILKTHNTETKNSKSRLQLLPNPPKTFRSQKTGAGNTFEKIELNKNLYKVLENPPGFCCRCCFPMNYCSLRIRPNAARNLKSRLIDHSGALGIISWNFEVRSFGLSLSWSRHNKPWGEPTSSVTTSAILVANQRTASQTTKWVLAAKVGCDDRDGIKNGWNLISNREMMAGCDKYIINFERKASRYCDQSCAHWSLSFRSILDLLHLNYLNSSSKLLVASMF